MNVPQGAWARNVHFRRALPALARVRIESGWTNSGAGAAVRPGSADRPRQVVLSLRSKEGAQEC